MVRFEKKLNENHNELVLVVGDVISTIACDITAQKKGVKLAHVELELEVMIGPCPKKSIGWYLKLLQTISLLLQ
jgi:hypothetical protein